MGRAKVIWARVFAVWLGVVLSMPRGVKGGEDGQRANTEAKTPKQLIEQLTQLDRPDIGYSASVTGQSFLPLGRNEVHTMMLFQDQSTSSETVKSLVKLGPDSLPALIESLNDARPTKITFNHYGGLGGLFIEQDSNKEKDNKDELFHGSAPSYTVTVGDICYVAIGQIVNRPYWTVRYQPTGIIMVQSIPRSKELRATVTTQWSRLTTGKHKESLAADLASDDEQTRNGASLRLAYYYPEALETLALKQLGRPTYCPFTVHKLIRDRLYYADSADDRKKIVTEFVAKHGEISRAAIKWALFQDLDTEEANEEGRLRPKMEKPYQARRCLIDVFGTKADVKSSDAPASEPLSDTAQARFVQILVFDRSIKLDHHLLDMLKKTNDDYLAKGCLDRLVGRGFDAEIESYLNRRLKVVKPENSEDLKNYQSKLGWNRLLAATELGLTEQLKDLCKEGIPVDGQGRDGRTALHIAVEKSDKQTVDELLSLNANPNIKDAKGRLPVQIAMDEDVMPIARQLIRNKSEIPDVFAAIASGSTTEIESFLKKEPNTINRRNRLGMTLLQFAAREGQPESVSLLIAKGADVNAVDGQGNKEKDGESKGWTPLHVAAMEGHAKIVELLIKKGAAVNAVEKREKLTPLHFAAWIGSEDTVAILLKHGADRNAEDDSKRTPISLARERDHKKVIKILEDK